ncbi:hypothetical protein HME9302_01066 [Alteripontixanthobacter maritimus]|uniref:Lipoprotein n=1 Tax=Alteripontixanthobacter maritimus TaxID=2161824 RepID=A0A369Q610_9SPHN|nr:hypothetical protein [Alteripontixanthobacter maritimus]RDC59870.1 hypothetical protein HME9302_01066 [Alteripontixanthobacter maritimus]
MRRIKLAAALPALALLAACGGEPADEDVADLDTPETASEQMAAHQALEAGAFADLKLGAKIVGPQGPEVMGTLSNAEGNFADIRSFVACPAGMDPCDPKTAPDGTVYTYVHVVYPGEDNEGGSGAGEGNDSSDIESASAFKMTRPAHGFTGAVGYSKLEAIAAIGRKADVIVTCDDGALVWSVEAGAGGNQWEQAEPLTFYWQSTLPPAGPAEAYAIDANFTTANGPGPYPAAKAGVANACDKTP